MSKIELLNCDCMEYMKGLPDKAFDLAIVDPPYGIDGNSHRNNQSRGKVCKSKAYHPALWDQPVPDTEYFSELFRVSKNQIIWGANHFIDLIPFRSSCWIVWDKVNDGTDFADCELAWSSFDTSVRRLRFQWSGMLQGDMKNKENRIHPTQKPVKLYKWLLHNYAKPVCSHKHTEEYKSLCTDCNKPFRILDTHGGSRSLAIACHEMGFDHVSCEIDTDYHNDSVKRFKEQTMQQKLFI